jgi:hypothetical protein
MNDPRTCERCGIFYYEWLHTDLRFEGEPLIPNMHVCPEPYPRETAEFLLSFYVNSGMVTTQTVKARIKLGLEG